MECLETKINHLEKKLETISEFHVPKHERGPGGVAIKLSTCDGKFSWQVYKTQFSIVVEANRWSNTERTYHLAASLRGDAADVLESHSDEQRHCFSSLASALELRFGEQCTKKYSRLQLKSSYQKVCESSQELAADIQRLSHLAFVDCPVETRDDLALHQFIESLRDPEIQKTLRLSEVKDINSALVCALMIEAAQQASRKDRCYISMDSIDFITTHFGEV